MEKKFYEHLLDIGFIDEKNLSQIIMQSYSNKKCAIAENNKFNKNMTEMLLLFFDNLTDIQKKYACFHLPAKFIKLSKFKLKEKLKNIVKRKELNNKIILSKYLFKWYRNKSSVNNSNTRSYKIFDINLDNNSKNFYKNHSYKSMTTNKLKKKINYGKNDKIYNTIIDFVNNVNNLNSSNYKSNNEGSDKMLIKKDKKYLANFNINPNNDYLNSLKNIYKNDKKNEKMKKAYINNNKILHLIKNSTLTNQKFDMNNISKDFIENNDSNENYISTNINTMNKNDNNKEMKNLKNVVNIKTFASNNSNSKLNIFNSICTSKDSNKKKNINAKFRNNNNLYNLIYCNNYNNLNNNNYIGNNNNFDFDLFTTKTPFKEKEIKTIEPNRKTKYFPSQRMYGQDVKKPKNQTNKISLSPSSSENLKEKPKSVNYKHVKSLYKNKKRCNTQEKLKNKVEKEEGITFHPMLYKNKYVNRITSNFMERNYSSPIHYKNENINDSNNISNNKKLDKKEKENIVEGMINRLYKNKKNDDSEENSEHCKKYTKKDAKSSYLKGYKKKI